MSHKPENYRTLATEKLGWQIVISLLISSIFCPIRIYASYTVNIHSAIKSIHMH